MLRLLKTADTASTTVQSVQNVLQLSSLVEGSRRLLRSLIIYGCLHFTNSSNFSLSGGRNRIRALSLRCSGSETRIQVLGTR